MNSTARRVLGGSFLRGIMMIASVLVSFYMMPFLVHALGDRWYGFWALAGTIVGYYAAIDLGLTPAVHRFLAMSYGRGDRDETSRVFSTALVLCIIACVVVLILTAVTWLAIGWFADPADLSTLRWLVVLLGTNFAIGFPLVMYNGVLAANLRYDISSYLQFARLIGRTIIVVAVITREPSVVALAVITLFTDLATNVATVVYASRLWPWLRVSPSLFERHRVREFYSYGVYSFLVRVGDLVRFGLDNVIVAKFLGVASVTHYSIAIRLTDSFQEMFSQGLSVLAPVFSRYHGTENRPALLSGVRQAARLTAALSATFAGAMIIFGKAFIQRWMGSAYLDAYWPMVVLVIGAFLNILQLPSLAYFYATARHRYYAALNGAEAAVNLVLSLILAPRFGMLGVAIGTAVPTAIIKLWYQPRYLCAHLGISIDAYWRELTPTVLTSLALQAPIAVIVWRIAPTEYWQMFALGFALYSVQAFALYMVVFTNEDRHVLSRAFPPLVRLASVRERLFAFRR
jgi:O-antigen/teichoic acid export membrane protein